MEEVETHNSEDDCWSALYGKVYDLTLYGPEHKGGSAKPRQVWSLCGIDGTSRYDNIHGNKRQWLDKFSSIVLVGAVTESVPTPDSTDDSTSQASQQEPPDSTPDMLTEISTTPDDNITMEEVATHDSSTDCWSALYDKVYDLTLYGEEHTGGNAKPDQVWSLCGIDGTFTYDIVHSDKRQWLDEIDSIVHVGALAAPAAAPAPDDSTTQPSSQEFEAATEITPEEVALHNSEEDCWSALYDKVYDLTLYGEEHTGGNAEPDQVWSLCGIDGTSKYDTVHGDNRQWLEEFSSIVEVGTLAASVPDDSTPQPTQRIISIEELASHDNPQDCWVAYYDSVYDLTVYAYGHPGPGEKVIHMSCGDDGTEAYAKEHSRKLLSLVVNDKVGSLEGAGTSNAPMIKAAAPIMILFFGTFLRMWQ